MILVSGDSWRTPYATANPFISGMLTSAASNELSVSAVSGWSPALSILAGMGT
jgi:hypothetical protein